MKPEIASKIKYGIWGVVCGAIIAMIIGFSWGGWSTAATAQRNSDKAVVASQAAICVAQFMKAADHDEKLKELKEINTWSRADFIEKGGWDLMPGQERADYDVSRACADGLGLLIDK
jgi:hypothetical protein